MTNYYFDSSCLVKYYFSEIGSDWVKEVVDARAPGENWLHTLAVSRIGLVEVAAAIAKRQRMGIVSREQQISTYAHFIQFSRNRLEALPVSNPILDLAATLTQRRPLRGYDAVHLAAGLTLNRTLTAAGAPALIFASADIELCEAAKAEGLRIVNPNTT